MRKFVMTLTLLSVFLHGGSSQARDEAIEIADTAFSIVGQSVLGETKSYKLKIDVARGVRFDLSADNETCGYEMQKTSQLGYVAKQGRFPVAFVDNAESGETYTISFFQNRMAYMGKTPCKFTFSIK
jgi:hypothetical protein